MSKFKEKKIIAVILLLLLCGIAFAEQADDPVVVRVGDFSYPLSLAQQSLDSAIKLSDATSEEPMSEEERAQLALDIIDNLVGIGLVETKLTEAGKHDFTEEEEEQMRAAARSRYEQLWQSVYQMMQSNGVDATEQEVADAMDEEGYTLDALYREYEVSERQRRAIELFVPPIILNETELKDFYESQFVAPDRERYKDDVALYEKEILLADNESFYTPEGYRYIRQILLEYPKEVTKALEPYKKKMEKGQKRFADALLKLTEIVTTTDDWSDLDEPRAAYDAEMAALEKLNREYTDRRREAALPLAQDTIDSIMTQYRAGIDFKTLITRFSADTSERNVTGPGYPLHPDSEGWPEDFVAAGMALQEPGDVSEPVLTDKGIHILYYDSAIPAGDHVLTDEETEMLKQSALYYYQVQELIKLFEEWKPDYDIEKHPELLTY